MVNVSRGAAVPSVFLVVVVAEAESITQTSEHGGKIQPYHFTPKGGFAEMGGTYSAGSRQEHESKGVARIGFSAEGRAIDLLTLVVITSIIGAVARASALRPEARRRCSPRQASQKRTS